MKETTKVTKARTRATEVVEIDLFDATPIENIKFLGVDTGKMNTQVVGADGLAKKIESRIKVDAEGVFGNTKTIQGRVCEISVDSPFSDNQNKNEEHSIFLGYNIISEVVEDGDIVAVGLGLPLDIYKNKEERLRYANNFLNNQEPIVVDDKSFRIAKVLVCPEGISATTQNKLSKKRWTLVVDIGGRNINFCIVDEYGRPVIASIDTFDEGMHKALKEIRKELRTLNITNMEEDDILRIVVNGGGNKQINDVISNYFDKFLKRVKHKIDKGIEGFNRSTTDLLFVGGTSKYLSDKIDTLFNNANEEIEDATDKYQWTVSDDALWDNAKAYYSLLLSACKVK